MISQGLNSPPDTVLDDLSSWAAALDCTSGTAFSLRRSAHSSWKQGAYDSANGLLLGAERLFRDQKLDQEVTSTAQLRLLLNAEVGATEPAIEIYSHLGPVEPLVRPWLSARAALTVAFCLASRRKGQRGRKAKVLDILDQASSFRASVDDPQELLYLDWLEARVRARLGDGRAEDTLLSLRNRACTEGPVLNALLLTLDLLALRSGDPQDLVEDLFSLRCSGPEIEAAVEAVEIAMARIPRGRSAGSDVWWAVTDCGFWVRHLFRLRHLDSPPPPFS